MKKYILFGAALLGTLLLHAQTKITKAGVVGKWGISAVEMPGIVTYDLDQDSLMFGEMIKSQLGDPQQVAMLKNTIKPQLAMFTKMSFTFNADGTAELGGGTPQAVMGTYTVDEETSVITTSDQDKAMENIKADFKDGKLRLTLKQAQGDVMVVLKRIKTT